MEDWIREYNNQNSISYEEKFIISLFDILDKRLQNNLSIISPEEIEKKRLKNLCNKVEKQIVSNFNKNQYTYVNISKEDEAYIDILKVILEKNGWKFLRQFKHMENTILIINVA